MSYANYRILDKDNSPITAVFTRSLEEVEGAVEKTLKNRPARYQGYLAWVEGGKRIKADGQDEIISLAERDMTFDAMELRRLESQLQDVVSKSKKILDKYPDVGREFVAAQVFHQIYEAHKDFDSVISDLEMSAVHLGVECLV